MTRRLIATAALAGLSWCLAATSGPALAASQAPAPPQAGAAGTPELLFDQGKRLFDAFQHDQAVPLFDRVIAQLAPSAPSAITGPIPKADLLVEAH